MADQTFTSGQVLTAAQQSALQTNIGLTYIGQTDVSGARPISVTGVFTSAFTNYRIVANVYGAAVEELFFRFYSGTNTVIDSGNYNRYGVSQTTTGAVTSAYVDSGTRWTLGDVNNNIITQNPIVMDIFNPNEATRTGISWQSFGMGNGQYLSCTGQLTVTTACTGFLLQGLNNNITGRVQVYGYRKG
jgi:hypothetical protein